MGSRKSAAQRAVEQAEQDAASREEQQADEFEAAAPEAEPEQDSAEPEQATKTEAELKREAYSAAVSTLRTKYNDEFKQLVKAEAEARGVTYTFRPTPEEKAAAQLEKLYADFPHLRPA
jgi:hypothetical protein